MAIEKKPQRKWLYLGDEDAARLDKLVESVGTMNEAMVLGALASAALRACEDLGYRVLPLKLVVPEASATHEPTKPKVENEAKESYAYRARASRVCELEGDPKRYCRDDQPKSQGTV